MNKSILLISSEYPPGPGGIGHHAYSLVTALVKEGHHLLVLAPGDYASKDEVDEFDEKEPYSIIRFKRIGKIRTYIHRWTILKRVLAANQIDTIILSGKFSLWLGYLLKISGRKVKTLAVLHGSEVNLSNRILRFFTHKSIASADVLVAVSNYTKSLLPNFILKGRNPVHVIPNGIHPLTQQSISDKIELKGSPALLTVGHVSRRKGQHRVIQALPLLQGEFPDIHYHLVGRPIEQEAFQTLAEELDVGHRITFHGRVKQHSDLAAYYQSADLFMLLSENQPNGDVEGFGIVALEANQQGLPVIGAKYCGVEDAVKNDSSGYLVDGDKLEEILEAVKNCIQNRERLPLESMEWAKQHDWSIIVEKFMDLLP